MAVALREWDLPYILTNNNNTLFRTKEYKLKYIRRKKYKQRESKTKRKGFRPNT